MAYQPNSENAWDIQYLLAEFENIKKGHPSSLYEEDQFVALIDYFDEADQLQNALDAAEIGVTTIPYSAMLKIKKADLLIASKKYREALHLLSEAEILDPLDINIPILRTDAYLALDKHEKALSILEEALTKFEGEERTELLFEMADVFDDYENFEKVFDCMKHILDEDPSNEEALHKICFWADYTGRCEESIKIHLSIIDQDPYSELAWFNLGSAYQTLKLYEKAIDAYKYVLAIDDKFEYAHRNIADAFMRLKKYNDALVYLHQVDEISKPDDIIYEAMGFCYEKLKKNNEARLYYKKASHVNPNDTKLNYKIATTYMVEAKWNKAIQYLEKALQMFKAQPEFLHAMGYCYQQKQQSNEAITYYMEALMVKSKFKPAWKDLIECTTALNQLENALEYTEVAYENTGRKVPLFMLYKVMVLYKMGATKESQILLDHILPGNEKYLKIVLPLCPEILNDQKIVAIISQHAKNKKSKKNNQDSEPSIFNEED
jgi:tetratricopeptide (TPR) repeat protein